MDFLTKEKSRQKRKGVNNQNNSPLRYELFPVINTNYIISMIFFINLVFKIKLY